MKETIVINPTPRSESEPRKRRKRVKHCQVCSHPYGQGHDGREHAFSSLPEREWYLEPRKEAKR